MRTSSNPMQQNAGSFWVANAQVMRLKSLFLVYYTAEYCSPERSNSTNENNEG